MTDAPKKIVSRPVTTDNNSNNNNSSNQNRTMSDYLQRTLTVSLTDGRLLVGRLVAFDKHMNMVLNQTREYPKNASPQGDDNRRSVGLVMLRGEHVVNVTAEKNTAKAAVNAKTTDNKNNGSSSSVVPGTAVAKTSEPKLPNASGVRRQRNEEDE